MFKVSGNRRLLEQRIKLQEDKNALIKALKNDDPKAAKQALTGMGGAELGLASKDFNQLAKELDGAAEAQEKYNDPRVGFSLDKARKLLGVGKDVKQSSQTHNPVTNQPWSSGPAKQPTYKPGTMVHDLEMFSHEVGHLSPNDSRDLYDTIVHGADADLQSFPNVKTFAKKLKLKAFKFTEQEMNDLNEFIENFMDSTSVPEEDKDWMEKISNKIFGF